MGTVLANPAMAAPEAPADSRLTERTFAPQDAPEDVEVLYSTHGNSVVLTWDNLDTTTSGSENHGGYAVRYRRDGPNEAWTTMMVPEATAVVSTAVPDAATPVVGYNDIDAVRVSALTDGDTYLFQVAESGTGGAYGTLSEPIMATPMAVPDQADDLEAEVGDRKVTLVWDDPGDDSIDKWQYYQTTTAPSDETVVPADADWIDIPDSDEDTESFEVPGLHGSTPYFFSVRAVAGMTASAPALDDDQGTAGDVTVTATPTGATATTATEHTGLRVTPSETDPGENATYVLDYVSGVGVSSGSGGITIEMADFGVPSAIDARAVVMRITDGPSITGCYGSAVDNTSPADGDCLDIDDVDASGVTISATAGVSSPAADQAANPEGVTISGEKVTLTIPDFGDRADGDQGIMDGDTVRVIFGQAAGITNPTEGGSTYPGKAYPWKVGDQTTEEDASVIVPILIDIDVDDNEAGRGDVVTVTGKGYKNGGTLTVWIDSNGNGVKDRNEIQLCDGDIGSSDTASCQFEVNKPPFFPGKMMPLQRENEGSCAPGMVMYCNLINAEDGRGNTVTMMRDDDGIADDQDQINDYTIVLVPSLSAAPTKANPGETVLLQLRDFMPGAISSANLAGVNVPISGTIPASGDYNVSVTIPNDVPEGRQSLQLKTNVDQDERVTLEIGGPNVRATPSEVVPNQRITLVGNGFTRDARTLASITIGGEEIDDDRINDGKGVASVTVDSGGNWSTSVDLPLTSATTVEGDREIVVRDDQGRQGDVMVTVAPRTITITPEQGRVGTLASIRGTGFPGQNDEGSSFNITVVYDADGREVTTSAQADASGSFETPLRIPTFAGIPSTNTVKVSFRDDNQLEVTTPVVHDVPESAITLTPASGPPGTVVTVTGEGFKSYVGVTSVFVGSIEVTPAPKPSTDVQGMFEFTVTIPGVETGTQSVKVDVGQITTSQPYAVTKSGINPGDIVEVAKGLENLGDNLGSIWHFNNDSKMWTFYDGLEGSDLEHLITGETYWLQIKSDQEAILNNKTKNLTCSATGNCWNIIVW